jgi:hypothetical protein
MICPDVTVCFEEIVLSPRLRTSAGRRLFLKQLVSVAALSSIKSTRAFASASEKPVSAVKNRAPLTANAFYSLPLGTVKPMGWLRAQLEIQRNGLSGHLDETWADVGPNSGWLGGTGESWERGPYFLDGLVPLAYLLDDARLKAKAQKYIDWTLQSQTPNGMFGPKSNDDWWPRMVMLKVLTQYAEATGDARVMPLMQRYFAYQLAELPRRPLRDWGAFRWQDNALSVLWLYNRSGDPKLLELVRLLHAQGFDWVENYADFKYKDRITAEFIKLDQGGGMKDLGLSTHGVNNGQGIKTGAVWSMVSGAEADRKSVRQAIAELDRYHGLPNGMFSCDEHFAGRNPSQGSELCTVVEYMYSLEQSIAVLGDAALGDRLEKLAFNALPGTLSDDMWSHQYNQEPNQVECSLHSKPWTTDGPESNLFGLEPHFGCCAANFHQGWPKFAASLLMASHEDGLVAAAYAPCEVRTMVRGTGVHLVEETDYPFKGAIRMTVNPDAPVAFPLQLRIPAWAAGTTIKVNGHVEAGPVAGEFARIERTWRAGDRVEIEFPLEPRVVKGFRDSVSIERGALVYSFGIGEDWLKLRDRGMTADWQIYPTTQWNYALAANEGAEKQEISVMERDVKARPFSAEHTPVKLHVQARQVPDWRAEDGVAGVVPQSPVASSEPLQTITLIPYAAAKLRITAFPQLKS